MASPEQSGHFFIYEHRLASFTTPQNVGSRRASTASTRAPKTLRWPHKKLSPVDLAKAGFYFQPLPQNPDNVVCFLCHKALDGWEEDDNPLLEHLKHSPSCGWAITAAIEAEIADYLVLHPLDPRMVEARKATFAGRWPYESKKGFKCKTKQLVEAGWKYTPTIDAEDMATCTYCQLALDGWEAGDKPIDEHYKRSPGCLYFSLLSEVAAPPKKSARSKASRLSVQSVATATSDLGSIADITADHDDSIMTTSSAMTQASRKGRPRKAASAKSRKPRAKKDEVVEIHEDEPENMEITAPPPPPPKTARGRKRGSDAIEDSVLTNAEAPAPKKRATRTKGSTVVDASVLSLDAHAVEAVPAKQPAGRKKGRTSAKSTRKPSQSSLRSQASTASLRGHVLDDDELDRQLQVDLDRPLTDDEDLQADSDSERKKAPAKAAAPEPEPVESAPGPVRGRPRKGTIPRKASTQRQKQPATDDFAMFDPAPTTTDEAVIDAELKTLETEAAAAGAQNQAEVPAAQEEDMVVPKKGRKAGTRKASKQTKAKEPSPPPAGLMEKPVEKPMEEAAQAKKVLPEPAQEPVAEPAVSDGLAEDHDVSTGTVITKTADRSSIGSTASNGAKRGRGRPPKKSKASLPPAEQLKQPEKPPASAIPAHVDVEEDELSIMSAHSAKKRAPAKEVSIVPIPAPSAPAPTVAAPVPIKRTERSLPPPPPPASAARVPGTPRVHAISSAKQATLSPSQSPQSSDAENMPPSARPAYAKPTTTAPAPAPATQITKRVVLAAVPVATPSRGLGSPSRRNVIAGLHSATPWTAVDLDAVFQSPGSKTRDGSADVADKVNGMDKLLRKGADLTSPEKRMTVEEWIFHNASLAENKLRHECETMVSAFEKEGTRAMNVLEGLVVD